MLSCTPLTQSITIEKGSRFFIAACKKNNAPHSFICLGIENKGEILSSIGKYIDGDKLFSSCVSDDNPAGKTIKKFLFSLFAPCVFMRTQPAHLSNEAIHFRYPHDKDVIAVSYKAFSLTYFQYVDFLYYLKALNPRLRAFIPVRERGNSVLASWRSLSVLPERRSNNQTEPADSCKTLGLDNTCRHTSINLIQKARGTSNTGHGVSTSFLKSYTLQANIANGKFDRLFILPLPPETFKSLSVPRLKVIEKLYNCMEAILANPYARTLSHKKLLMLRRLYENITSNEEQTLDEFFGRISASFNQNKKLIQAHRGFHFPGAATDTEKMFREIMRK
ncbi:hypothetical protein ACFORL_02615 [Legionella dresdenensis]|uniref:Uncharacterized protein n=1 Tax=Legionella dresdenensis TaxID=450200 RepID=A0ABV8CDC7_9GAMM